MNPSTETIWSEYSKQLKGYILKRVSDSSEADDILQEVFIKIHEKIDLLKDQTKINGWIYRITKNSIIDYYRKKKLKYSDIQQLTINELNTLDDSNLSEEINPEERIASGLQLMINSLPKEYAQALNMVEFQGLTQVQLAKELNISVSGAKSRIQRGRQMLKDSLMKCCHYEFDKYGTIISSHPIRCCCCHQNSENN